MADKRAADYLGSLKTLVLIISVETYVDYPGGTLKIFYGGVPFLDFNDNLLQKI